MLKELKMLEHETYIEVADADHPALGNIMKTAILALPFVLAACNDSGAYTGPMKPCGVDRVYNSGPEIGALDMITKAPRRVKDKVYYDGSFSLGQDFIEYTCESIWRSDQTYPSYRRMYCQTNSWDRGIA
jgi:hypothetical protein